MKKYEVEETLYKDSNGEKWQIYQQTMSDDRRIHRQRRASKQKWRILDGEGG